MIKIKRTKTPDILAKNAENWKTALLAAKNNNVRNKVEAKYGHKNIKNSLVNMFHGKCAYCESQVRHIDYGHIEHYRPKSKFPKLTFEWSNLLLACGVCNGKAYKGDKFPEANEGGPIINPADDDPNDHFNFCYDQKTNIASVYGTTRRGQTTEKLLGLNRDDLRKYRSSYVRKIWVLAQLSKSDSEAKTLLEEAKQDNAEYAAFVRQLL